MKNAREPSATKRGPGRYHQQGHEKASPVKKRGTPWGFVQHTDEANNARRKRKAAMGARQVRIAEKAARRAAKAAA